MKRSNEEAARRGARCGRGALALLALAVAGCRAPERGMPSVMLVNPPYVEPIRIERGPEGTPVSLYVEVKNSGENIVDSDDDGIYFCVEADSGACPPAGAYRVGVRSTTVNGWNGVLSGSDSRQWVDFCDPALWRLLEGKEKVHVRVQVLRKDGEWSFSPQETNPEDPPFFADVPVVRPFAPRSLCVPRRDLMIDRPELELSPNRRLDGAPGPKPPEPRPTPTGADPRPIR